MRGKLNSERRVIGEYLQARGRRKEEIPKKGRPLDAKNAGEVTEKKEQHSAAVRELAERLSEGKGNSFLLTGLGLGGKKASPSSNTKKNEKIAPIKKYGRIIPRKDLSCSFVRKMGSAGTIRTSAHSPKKKKKSRT